ncbi:membrane protein [Klebsiella pneumoniae]|uniref:Membrane protein n=1 Tax=Klebsiella pneumoniae TaxID=573 RepID=A0A2X3FCI4_KLEPN|nr:membrane protein [Klebsiella pneumoniae]
MKHLFRHWRTSGAVIGSLLKKGSIAVLALLVVFLAGRIYESQRGPALHRWHTWSGNEMSAEEIDQATFAQYLAREKTIFADLQREVTEALPEEDKTPVNRFYRHSRVWPGQFKQDWNRFFCADAAGQAARQRGAPPWPDRFALQRALSGATLAAAGVMWRWRRVCRDTAPRRGR